MPRLAVAVPASPVDVARWALLVPLLLARFRALDFDADGVVRLPEGRKEGLRVVAGEPGRVGATYRLVTWEQPADHVAGERRPVPSEPTYLTVERDDARALKVAVVVPTEPVAGGAGSRPTPQTYAVTLTLPTPDAPTQAQAEVSLPLNDLPRWMGRRLELQGVLDVADPTHPVLMATGELREASAAARLEHTGQTLRADLAVTPRGLLVFAGLMWPFVAGRARRTVAEGMTRWWSSVVDTLDPSAPLDVVADELMRDFGRALVDRVPA